MSVGVQPAVHPWCSWAKTQPLHLHGYALWTAAFEVRVYSGSLSLSLSPLSLSSPAPLVLENGIIGNIWLFLNNIIRFLSPPPPPQEREYIIFRFWHSRYYSSQAVPGDCLIGMHCSCLGIPKDMIWFGSVSYCSSVICTDMIQQPLPSGSHFICSIIQFNKLRRDRSSWSSPPPPRWDLAWPQFEPDVCW